MTPSDDEDPWEKYKRGVIKGARPKGVKAKGPKLPPPTPAFAPSPSVKRKRTTQTFPLIDGKIDLHGMTQAEAHARLSSFVTWHAARGAKHLLIVTGKGKNNQSILRHNAPRWCDVPPLSLLINTLCPADQTHGGDGAFVLSLIKQRK